eukprot:GSChrysophyteH1.ASY1.ANO1.2994.1 assembled CDS
MYALHKEHNYTRAVELLEMAVLADPQNGEYHQLLGAAAVMNESDPNKAQIHLRAALDILGWNNDYIVANYIESLRAAGMLKEARKAAARGIQHHPRSVQVLFNSAKTFVEARRMNDAYQLFRRINAIEPSLERAWLEGADMLLNTDYVADSLRDETIEAHPTSAVIVYLYGAHLHKLGRVDEALRLYHKSRELRPRYIPALANIGAAYQQLGEVEAAAHVYEQLLPHMPRDAGLLNNYGSCLGVMGRRDEEQFWLLEAYKLDPTFESVNINLAGLYQDEGSLMKARMHLTQAEAASRSASLLGLRKATLMSPVHCSWQHAAFERERSELEIHRMLSSDGDGELIVEKIPVDSALDRIHFYIVYQGLNDRYMQELIAQSYRCFISGLSTVNKLISANIEAQDSVRRSGTETVHRTRIGFMSKFFGLFEPHGLLLDGIMQYLPRESFEVWALPVTRTDGKPLAHTIADAADHTVSVPLTHVVATRVLSELELDILIYADTLSEPISHFLQVAFWGNPITSGSRQIDYFVSSVGMEHPYRCRMRYQGQSISTNDDPYTEQVVMLEGQGIWYYPPISALEDVERTGWDLVKSRQFRKQLQSATAMSRWEVGLQEDWFVFLCPQSVFKMHPLFDEVMLSTLVGNRAHLLVTAARRESWSRVYRRRFAETIATLFSSERFTALLRLADVLLHPFPFDGSKTSADSIYAERPFVTLPSEYLRGRMGVQFMRTMNIPELVARNRSHYIQIARALVSESSGHYNPFYQSVKSKIIANKHLIWSDMEVPYEWTRFLLRVAPGHSSHKLAMLSFTEFLNKQNKVDIKAELLLKETRDANRREFDASFGDERWLLEEGVAVLQTHVIRAGAGADAEYTEPRIFHDWRSSVIAKQQHQQQPFRSLDWLQSLDLSDEKWLLVSFEEKTEAETEMQQEQLLEQELATMYELINEKRVAAAKTVGQSLYWRYLSKIESESAASEDAFKIAKFLANYGCILYLQGDHKQGNEVCSRAHKLQPKPLSLMCIGVTAMYLSSEPGARIAFHKQQAVSSLAQLYSENGDSMAELGVFAVSKENLESTYMTALQKNDQLDECSELLSSILYGEDSNLSPEALMVMTMVSSIEWSQSSLAALQSLAHLLLRSRIISSKDISIFAEMHWPIADDATLVSQTSFLWEESKRLQNMHSHLLNPAITLYTLYNRENTRRINFQLAAQVAQQVGMLLWTTMIIIMVTVVMVMVMVMV